jgi:hypothetical protein
MPEDKSDEERAEEKFVEDSLTRGDAAKPDEEGNLPPGATHEIVEEGDEAEGKPPKIKRRRFSAS